MGTIPERRAIDDIYEDKVPRDKTKKQRIAIHKPKKQLEKS